MLPHRMLIAAAIALILTPRETPVHAPGYAIARAYACIEPRQR